MFKITKEFHFSAGHKVEGLKEGHPCARFHGHNYIVRVELSAENLDQIGMVQDYGELKPIKEYIDRELDHQYLNTVLDFNPTAELMAYHFCRKWKEQFPLISAIEISETPKTNARYEPTNN
jgi:6-pyruvoyltetrahydropterin/6-carboxytetrahydropterin synthase